MHSPEIIDELLGGVIPGLALLAGMQLDVFTVLSNKAMTVDEVAAELKEIIAGGQK